VVFAAPALSMHLFERGPLEKSVLGFVIFCALSGTVYLLNDVADLERLAEAWRPYRMWICVCLRRMGGEGAGMMHSRAAG